LPGSCFADASALTYKGGESWQIQNWILKHLGDPRIEWDFHKTIYIVLTVILRGPPYTRSLLYKCTKNLLGLSHWLNPKADVIHSGKSHIWCTNHYRHEPITKPTHKSWHYYKELHKQPVSSNLYIV
jgi:hypothetical protein